MRRRVALAAGAAALLGAALAVLVSLPAAWYGVPQTDAYVFDPAPLTPLWVSRTVVPVLSVAAVLGLVAGTAGLARRDWAVAGRARRWGAAGAAVGLLGVAVGAPALLSARGAADGLVLVLVGLAAGGLGLLVVVPATALLAYGYARTPRPRLGYAFAAVGPGGVVLGYLAPGPTTPVAAVLPAAVAWGLLGRDLVWHPEALAAAAGGDDPETETETETAADAEG